MFPVRATSRYDAGSRVQDTGYTRGQWRMRSTHAPPYHRISPLNPWHLVSSYFFVSILSMSTEDSASSQAGSSAPSAEVLKDSDRELLQEVASLPTAASQGPRDGDRTHGELAPHLCYYSLLLVGLLWWREIGGTAATGLKLTFFTACPDLSCPCRHVYSSIYVLLVARFAVLLAPGMRASFKCEP